MTVEAVLAIDPGPTESAWVIWDGKKIRRYGAGFNSQVLNLVGEHGAYGELVIEQIAAMGMAVGAEIFETVFWSGRFAQAFGREFHRLPRMTVKMHLCRDSRAKDGNLRQAIIDRLGAPSRTEHYLGPKGGEKRRVIPGPTAGIVGDQWQALALALTWWDRKFPPTPRLGAISMEEVPF